MSQPTTATATMLWAEARHVPAHVMRAGVRILPLRRTRRSDLMPLFDRADGAQAGVWWTRWRLFFRPIATLVGYDDGQQSCVNHDLYEQRA